MAANALSTLINDELQRRGWRAADLAEAAGLRRSTLSNILTNPERVPELDTLQSISDALEVPLRRLVEACGFPVDRPGISSAARAAAIIEAVPQLAFYLERLMQLPPDDQKAVLAMVEALIERRQGGAGSL